MYSLGETRRYIFAALSATHMTCWYANSMCTGEQNMVLEILFFDEVTFFCF
jgi:hypothetical protein